MTATDITPGYVRADRPLPFLAHLATDLLALAEDAALPMPRSLRLSAAVQEVSLGYPDGTDSLRALHAWAGHFGSVVTGRPHTSDNGQTKTYCEVRFMHDGLTVEAYAFITADQDGQPPF